MCVCDECGDDYDDVVLWCFFVYVCVCDCLLYCVCVCVLFCGLFVDVRAGYRGVSFEVICFVYLCNVCNYNECVVVGYIVLFLFVCVDVVCVCEMVCLFFFFVFFFFGFDIRFRLFDFGFRRSFDFVFLFFSFFYFLVVFCFWNRYFGECWEFDGYWRFVFFFFDVYYSGRSRSINCGNCRSENF